ncbi:MAG: hypothetical protein AAFW00_23425 [Bacteroidota bacterium]
MNEDNLEKRVENLISELIRLHDVEQHLAVREILLNERNLKPGPNERAFIQLRREILQKIFHDLLMINIESSVFQEVFQEMIPSQQQKVYQKRLNELQQKIEFLLAG